MEELIKEFKKKMYLPIALSTPRLLARPKPKLLPLFTQSIEGKRSLTYVSDPSLEALSTTITSKSILFVNEKIESKQSQRSTFVL